MTKFVGQPVLRREDDRLLCGGGQYIADLELPRMLHAVFVRSPLAHARIRSVDKSRAQHAPGVVLVLDGSELRAALPPVRDNQLPLPGNGKRRSSTASSTRSSRCSRMDKARHVGEAVAVVVAESPAEAEDAAELVSVDLRAPPAIVDPEAALSRGSPARPRAAPRPTRSAGSRCAKAMPRAPWRARRTASGAGSRITVMPRCRWNAAASPPTTTGAPAATTVWSSTQVVHWVQRETAATLGVPEARVRCIAPDVGGGFGLQGARLSRGHAAAVPRAACSRGRCAGWSTRREHLSCSCHSRDQFHDAEIAFDGEGRILALHDRFTVDCGAWNPLGVAVVYNTAAHLCGPYQHRPPRRSKLASWPPTRCRMRPIAAPDAPRPRRSWSG